MLHRLGLRYRVAMAPEPGLRRRADIVFTRARVAVFIDGCFWHGCPEHGRSSFNHNADYWPAKIAANIARDTDTNIKLARAGWHVLRYWEHQDAAAVVADIQQTVVAYTSHPQEKSEKYPRLGSAKVPITSPRSRKRLNSSQLVSGSNAQPWHAARLQESGP